MESNLFTVFRRFLRKKEEGLPEVGYTRDLSRGGVYFYTGCKLRKGERISLSIHMASDWAEGGKPPTLEGKARILRVESARDAFPPTDFKGIAARFDTEPAVSF